MTKATALESVAHLYKEHMNRPFPSGLRGADRADLDMVMIDAETAGWVSTWLKNGGSLDARGHIILQRCIARLDQVIPVLSEADDPEYWNSLREMAQLVAASQQTASLLPHHGINRL